MDEQEAITKAQALLNRQGDAMSHRWLCTGMLQKQIVCSKVVPNVVLDYDGIHVQVS